MHTSVEPLILATGYLDQGPPLAVHRVRSPPQVYITSTPGTILYMCTLPCLSLFLSVVLHSGWHQCLSSDIVMVFDSSGTSQGGPGGSGRAQAVWVDALMSGPMRSLPPYQPPPHPQPAPPSRYHQPTYTSPWLRVSSNRYLLPHCSSCSPLSVPDTHWNIGNVGRKKYLGWLLHNPTVLLNWVKTFRVGVESGLVNVTPDWH